MIREIRPVSTTPGGYTVYGDYESKVCVFCGQKATNIWRNVPRPLKCEDFAHQDLRAYVVDKKCLARCKSSPVKTHAGLIEYILRLEERGSMRGRPVKGKVVRRMGLLLLRSLDALTGTTVEGPELVTDIKTELGLKGKDEE
jgi:hypothetical protein